MTACPAQARCSRSFGIPPLGNLDNIAYPGRAAPPRTHQETDRYG